MSNPCSRLTNPFNPFNPLNPFNPFNPFNPTGHHIKFFASKSAWSVVWQTMNRST